MLNRAQLIGNVGKDPECGVTNGGKKFAKFSIATSEQWRDKQSGEKKEKTEWHHIVFWGDGIVDVVEKYVRKGSRVFVEGKIQTRKWQDQDGKDRWSTEIVVQGLSGQLKLLDRKEGNGRREDAPIGDDDAPPDHTYGGRSNGGTTSGTTPENKRGFLDDDIPFSLFMAAAASAALALLAQSGMA